MTQVPPPPSQTPVTIVRTRRFRFRRILLWALLLLIAAGAYEIAANRGVRETLVQGILVRDPRAAFGHKDAVTVMLLGRDEDRDNRSRVMKTLGRSDTILLARLDFTKHTIQLLSVPRDTRVRIPGYRGWHKINAAHAIGGPDLTEKTVERLLGVSPDETLVIDYRMLRKVIDAIGGVRVNVDRQLDYDDNWGNLHIHLKPGWQTLNGTQAMGFVRFRHSNDGRADSDFVRIQRQQALLQALKARLHDPVVWLRIPRVLETVRREMAGTMTYPQLVAVASFARSVPKTNIGTHTLPIARSGGSFVYADVGDARALAGRLFGPASSTAVVEEPGIDRERTRRPRTGGAVAAPVPSAAEKEAPDIPEDEPEIVLTPEPAVDEEMNAGPDETVEPEVNVAEPAPEGPAVPEPGTPDPTPAPTPQPSPEPAPEPAPNPGAPVPTTP